jgi:hypothetical protein
MISSIFDVKPELRRGQSMGRPRKASQPITDDADLSLPPEDGGSDEIDEAFEDPFKDLDDTPRQAPLRQTTTGLFAGDAVAQAEEKRLQLADEQRQADRQIGLLIGPKNLEKLRAFGYDVALVNPDHKPLASGTAHKGLSG